MQTRKLPLTADELAEMLDNPIRKIRNRIRTFCTNVVRTIEFAKFVWVQDLDVDSDPILRLIQMKLRHIKKHHETCALGRKDLSKPLNLCLLLIQRLLDDNYDDLAFRQHDLKWGESDFEFIDRPNGNRSLRMTRPKANTPELIEQERKEYRRLLNKPEELKKQDLDLLFTTLRKNIERMWC
jgi:hypothetical protein